MIRPKHKINQDVRFPQVRLIGREDGGLMSSRDAFIKASSENLDLILINETANPPVVRIGDYTKFLYEQEKAEKERKKNAPKNETREIQLSMDISDHDMTTKAKKAIELIGEGAKIKVSLLMKGRQKASPERGQLVMLKFAEKLSEHGVLEAMPKAEGSRWLMIIKPKKNGQPQSK